MNELECSGAGLAWNHDTRVPQGRQRGGDRDVAGSSRKYGFLATPEGRESWPRQVIAGFAGATADAFTLFERLEKKLEQYTGSCCAPRSSSPRTGGPTSICGNLEAMMIVADEDRC